MTKHQLLSILLGYITILPLQAQSITTMEFAHFGLDEGLSHTIVDDITQDKYGQLWLATQNGLNKFDGYQFTTYSFDLSDSTGVANGIVRACFTDCQGEVWIGTDEGLSHFNHDLEQFEHFSYQNDGKKQPIHNIAEISEQKLLLYTLNKNLWIFDKQTKQFSTDLPVDSMEGILPSYISSQDEYTYIGTQDGVYIYSTTQKTLNYVPLSINESFRKYAFLQQAPYYLWVGTNGGGLFRYNLQTGKVTQYTHQAGTKGSISSNYIRSMTLDHQGRLWIGTMNALNIYDEQNDCFQTYAGTPENNGGNMQLSIRKIYRDTQGGMWMGTYLRGLYYYHPLRKQFSNLQYVPGGNSLNCNVINCLVEDSHKNIWIGTNGGGLNCYNPQTGQFTYYTQKNGLASNDVKALFIDEANNQVYIGTHAGGLQILNPKTGYIKKILSSKNRNIYHWLPTLYGDGFWSCGMRSFMRFDTHTQSYQVIHPRDVGISQASTFDRLFSLFRDSKKRLWLIHEKKLLVYNETKEGLTGYPLPVLQSIEKNFITCMYEAGSGLFWFGTRNGIFSLDEATGQINQYTTADGLPSDAIHSILEDSEGNLWLGTEKGLSRFNVFTRKFRNYTSEDGLQSNLFTEARLRTDDGKMYFGGINGISSFVPEQLIDNPYTSVPVISELRLFGRRVTPGDETGILIQSISETEHITLSAQQSMFSLRFTTTNYVAGNHNTFAYMLEGYDHNWRHASRARTVSYSNLPHGTYRFLVRVANNDGKWNEQTTALSIKVLPVWYKTWWATLLFVLAFLGAVAAVVRYFWMRKSMQLQLLAERQNMEREKEVHEMKQRFFIDISHELRTPLTLILAPVQELLRTVTDRQTYKQLGFIEKNAKRLLHLVNQLMDYRRAELGVFQLRVRKTDVRQVVEKIFLYYDWTARKKGIQYDLYSDPSDEQVLCDPAYIELILNNLLSNAFKYTTKGQSITVILRREGSELLLQVEDTGCGIAPEQQSKVFERFYQADTGHLGTGIGLALVKRLVQLHHGRIELWSEPGKGSRFSVYLPTDPSAYAENERATSADADTPIHTVNEQQMFLEDVRPTEDETDGEPTNEEANEETETILVVEDNPDINRYLCNNLGQKYHVITATNGQEALDLLAKTERTDLILTDVMMPVMDGLQLCKHIKQNLNTCHIPVIILSAKAEQSEQLEGLGVGADDYICKPFSMTLLTTKIDNLLRTRYRTIRLYSQPGEIDLKRATLNPLDEEFLRKALDIIHRHLDDSAFTVATFAEEIFMNRVSLNAKIKALTGLSTRDFIRKVRLDKAHALLKEGRHNINEVSAMVGFSAVSYFSHCFKNQFGYLPSEINTGQ